MCGHVENVGVVEVEAEVVEAMHQMTSYHSAFARSRCTLSSSFAPWIAVAGSTTPFPLHAALVAPYTSCRPPRATFTLIRSVHAPNHGCPHIINFPFAAAANHLGPYFIVTNKWGSRSALIPLL